jgi:hypothetical protein
LKKGCTAPPLGTSTARTCKTNQREDSVDSGPNPEETDAVSQKQPRVKNARGAKEQRRQEAEERLERKLIRQEEREQIRQEEQEERKRERQKARG